MSDFHIGLDQINIPAIATKEYTLGSLVKDADLVSQIAKHEEAVPHPKLCPNM
jgi:hypothetical protein